MFIELYNHSCVDRIAKLSNRHPNCNWDRSYANSFPSRLKTPTWTNWWPLLNRQ